jgi:hypothetical protein
MNPQQPTIPDWDIDPIPQPPNNFSTTRSEFIPESSSESGETSESIPLDEYFQSPKSFKSSEPDNTPDSSDSFLTVLQRQMERLNQFRYPYTPSIAPSLTGRNDNPNILNSTTMWQRPEDRNNQRARSPSIPDNASIHGFFDNDNGEGSDDGIGVNSRHAGRTPRGRSQIPLPTSRSTVTQVPTQPITQPQIQSQTQSQIPIGGNQDDFTKVLADLSKAINRLNPSEPSKEVHIVPFPTFKAGEQDPLTWLQSFEDACEANHITEGRRMELIPAYLKSLAHAWWIQIKDDIVSWDNAMYPNNSFVALFKRKFCTSHQKSRWMNQLRNRIQKPGETVDEYWDALFSLYERVDPRHIYPAEDRLQQFLNGLRNEIREPVEMSIPNDLEEALYRARAVESTFSRNAPLSAYSFYQPAQNTGELQEVKTAITSLAQGFQQLVTNNRKGSNNNYNRNNNRKETRTCNNCGKVGHIAVQCYSNRVNNSGNNNSGNNQGSKRCYTCNKFGHFSAQCPQKGNNNNRGNSSSNSNSTRNQFVNLPRKESAKGAHQSHESLN